MLFPLRVNGSSPKASLSLGPLLALTIENTEEDGFLIAATTLHLLRSRHHNTHASNFTLQDHFVKKDDLHILNTTTYATL